MGGNNSKEEYHDEDDDEKHSFCSFPHPIFCTQKKRKYKPFGTPQTTPKPTRPPIYGGLEAEPSTRSIGDLFELYKQSAVIHDGEVRTLKYFIITALTTLHTFPPHSFQKVIFFLHNYCRSLFCCYLDCCSSWVE